MDRRVIRAGSAILLLSAALLAGCQSAEGEARRQAREQADLRNARAFCAMIDEAERVTVARRQLLPDNEDCAYFKRKGTLAGFSHADRDDYVNIYEGLRVSNAYGRARKAALPAGVSGNRDATTLYHKLLVRGFDEETAGAVARSPQFAAAVLAFGQVRQARD